MEKANIIFFVRSGTFYFADVSPWDWTAPQNDALWQDAMKTLFDPCPVGWRVPKSGQGADNTWQAFTHENGVCPDTPLSGGLGRTWPTATPVFQTWCPSMGCRHRLSGNINPTTVGYLWAATALQSEDGTAGSFSVYYSSYGVGNDYVHNHANAFSVRCIRE